MNNFLKKNYQYLIFIFCLLLLVYFTYKRNLNYTNEMNIDNVSSGISAARILLMDKQYARSFGFVYPIYDFFYNIFFNNHLDFMDYRRK